MLKIRLTRIGRKHDPSFRIVVTDSRRAPRSGAYLEVLGFYNPRKVLKVEGEKNKKSEIDIKEDRAKFWLEKGAQVSPVIHNLFVERGIIKGDKIKVSKTKKKEGGEDVASKEGEEKEASVAETAGEEESMPAKDTEPENVGESGEAPEEPKE
ncbi:MAG: 30S ribosomal protein S16 [Candidatus Marinimicrobia bacterium]|nr:30S ribosomal protein S16 [Candidatus Neomarinimicrobiota bacterium]